VVPLPHLLMIPLFSWIRWQKGVGGLDPFDIAYVFASWETFAWCAVRSKPICTKPART